MRTKVVKIGFFTFFMLLSCRKYEYIEYTGPRSSFEEKNGVLVSTDTHTGVENKLFDLVNEYRSSQGLNKLQFESVSYYFAKEHTKYMISKKQTSHAFFNKRAENISKRTGATMVSENVAKDYDTIYEAFEAWLESPGHRKNLEGDYTHSAIGIVKDSNGNLYFTQIFSR